MARDLVSELLSREKGLSQSTPQPTFQATGMHEDDLVSQLLAREQGGNSTTQNQSAPGQPNQQSMIDNITNSTPFNFVLGAGDALKNTISGAASLLPGVNINPVKTGSGTAYDVGNVAGNIGAFVGGGEALDALRFAGEGIPFLGALAKQLGGGGVRGVARRAIGTGVAGAAENPEDKVGGLEKGAGMSLAFDAIPGALKGLGKAAEFLNPQKFTTKLAESIKNSYEGSVKKAANEYNPVLEKLGNEKILENNPTNEYLNLDKSMVKNYFSPDLKKMQEKFLTSPTLQNAHDLQSQLYTRISKLSSKKPEAFTANTIEALSQARDALRKDMVSFLKEKNPELADKYLKGTDIFRKEVAPFRDNPTVFKLATGKKQSIEPQQLEKSLIAVKENKQLPESHYLSQALEQLSKKISRGKAAQTIIPMVAGGVAGEMLAPGIGGGIAGAMGGSAIGALGKKLGTPSLFDLATNPSAIKAAQNLNSPYQALIKSILANKLQGT